jgi:hypothetical protein
MTDNVLNSCHSGLLHPDILVYVLWDGTSFGSRSASLELSIASSFVGCVIHEPDCIVGRWVRVILCSGVT